MQKSQRCLTFRPMTLFETVPQAETTRARLTKVEWKKCDPTNI